MKIKTSELTGAALDWAVAKADGMNPYAFVEQDCGQSALRPLTRWCGVNVSPAGHDVFAPSTDWAQGGPIIERERIIPHFRKDDVVAYYFNRGQIYRGPTALIAAMRCYVTSKLGDEVEVPDELVQS